MTSADEADQTRHIGVLHQAHNPFDSAAALRHSNYCYVDGGRLVRQRVNGQLGPRADGAGLEPSVLTAFVHEGDVNPMLTDFGDRSEAAQYSGRHVDGGWRCPFQAKSVSPDREENDGGSR